MDEIVVEDEFGLPPNRVAPPNQLHQAGALPTPSIAVANGALSKGIILSSKTLENGAVPKVTRISAGIQSPLMMRRIPSRRFQPLVFEDTTSSGRVHEVDAGSSSQDLFHTSRVSFSTATTATSSGISTPSQAISGSRSELRGSGQMSEEVNEAPAKLAYMRSCIGILRALEIVASFIAILLTTATPHCAKPKPCAEEAYTKWRDFFAGMHVMIMLTSLVGYVAYATGLVNWHCCKAIVRHNLELVYLIGMGAFLLAAVIGFMAHHGGYVWNIVGLVFGCITIFLYTEHVIVTARQLLKDYRRTEVQESTTGKDKTCETKFLPRSVSGESASVLKVSGTMVSINLDSPSDPAVINFKELEGLS